jgi:hypothetical protein
MDQIPDGYGIIIILLLLFFIYCNNHMGFNAVNKDNLIKEIIDNQDLFIGPNYDKLKNKLSWVDASIYSSVKLLKTRNVNLTPEILKTII